MKTVPAGKFKQHCLGLLDEVQETGRPIVVTKRGRPVARLVPVIEAQRAGFRGALLDRTLISGDIVCAATSEDDWNALSS